MEFRVGFLFGNSAEDDLWLGVGGVPFAYRKPYYPKPETLHPGLETLDFKILNPDVELRVWSAIAVAIVGP